MTPLFCSVGVFAYNEEKNIAKLLDALLNQKLQKVEITEIIVVSSACTDSTDDIVKSYCKSYPTVKLIQEKQRNGKSASINRFIKESCNEFLVIESADTIPAPNTIELLVSAFLDPKVGMTGGRPKPENSKCTFIGYAVNLLWSLHHKMALISPKLGEMIAFRKVFKSIPAESAVDEASIEAQIREQDLEIKYIPNATIHNKGPEVLSDFVLQRRRIEAGHIWLKDNQSYKVSSQSSTILAKLALSELINHPGDIHRFTGVVLLEIYCRILGRYDYYIKRKNPFIWDIADSTKDLKHK